MANGAMLESSRKHYIEQFVGTQSAIEMVEHTQGDDFSYFLLALYHSFPKAKSKFQFYYMM